MISNMKRNKTLVKSCVNYVNSVVLRSYDDITRRGNINVTLKRGGITFNVPVLGTLRMGTRKVLALEDSKGRIYVGLDTNNVILRQDDIGYTNRTSDAICNQIYNGIREYGVDFPRILDRLTNDGNSDVIDLLKNNGYYHKTAEALKNTVLYQEFMSELNDRIRDSKACFELYDDDFFKFLSNRRFVPIIILDIDKGTSSVTTRENPGSDRKMREIFDISDFIKTGKFEKPYSYVGEIKVPYGLTTLVVES